MYFDPFKFCHVIWLCVHHVCQKDLQKGRIIVCSFVWLLKKSALVELSRLRIFPNPPRQQKIPFADRSGGADHRHEMERERFLRSVITHGKRDSKEEMRHLHAQKRRGGVGDGIQLPRRAERGLRSIHNKPEAKRVGVPA